MCYKRTYRNNERLREGAFNKNLLQRQGNSHVTLKVTKQFPVTIKGLGKESLIKSVYKVNVIMM